MATEKRKKVICLVHFNPLEFFPPVMNMANYFGSKMYNSKLKIFSTNASKTPFVFEPNTEKVSISRIGWTGQSLSRLKRFVTYFLFNIGVLIWLVFKNPSAILYCETISSFAPVFYKRFLNRKVKLLIHYHEYMTLEEYRDGMLLVRLLHNLEVKIYDKAKWISHTNKTRMELFKNDLGVSAIINERILPNYPPESWSVKQEDSKCIFDSNRPIKVIYLGNLNLEKLYIKEFANWVVDQGGAVIWDIYSLNSTYDTDKFFRELSSPYIKFMGAVSYFELPDILRKYDVGVILYKGLSLNWIFSVPNKLFEYHVSGLDVWISNEIISASDYLKEDSYPVIRTVDFSCLPKVESISGNNLSNFKLHPFKAEIALEPLWREINN